MEKEKTDQQIIKHSKPNSKKCIILSLKTGNVTEDVSLEEA